jgi:hypothetical protein
MNPTEQLCDCGHPISYHHTSGRASDAASVVHCGWNPQKSHRHCGCTQITTTGVPRDETYEQP